MPHRENSPAARQATPSLPDSRLASPLIDFYLALDVDDLFRTGDALLRTALPLFHTLAALPCLDVAPIFIRTTMPIPDDPEYWGRFYEAGPPLLEITAKYPGLKLSIMSRDCQEDALLASRFYREFMQPGGWRYAAGFLFWEENKFLGQFSMIRTQDQGDFTAEEIRLLESLHPHFETMIRQVMRLDRERSRQRSLESALEATPEGRIILDWNQQIVFRNRTAVKTCAAWKNGSLSQTLSTTELLRTFAIPDDISTACDQLLAEYTQAVKRDTHRSRGWQMDLHHPSISGLSARIRLLENKTAQAVEPTLLIELSRLTSSPGSERSWPVHVLTGGERRVAELAAGGGSNEQIAQALGVSVHTVRAHLREVFSKLDIKRRSQLQEAMRILIAFLGPALPVLL